MKMKLVLDVDKCCACGACAVACMDQNDIDIAHMTPFRRVADFELNGGIPLYLCFLHAL